MFEDTEIRAAVERAAKKLKAANAMLATAESCTGGWIAKALTELPGSSAWFAGGVVGYSNAAKIRLLGVDPLTLDTYGAVSEATVQEMALGALTRFEAEVSTAVSGVAGPDGGTDTNPVGTVWIAWAAVDAVTARKFMFEGDREAVRRQSVIAALDGIPAS